VRLQKIPLKSKGSLGNILKIYTIINFKNLEEMDIFLDAYNILKLNKQDTVTKEISNKQ
jgi:hypothetical protein